MTPMKLTFPKTCVALDLETTDLTPNRGDIIEVAAAKFKGDKVLAEFQFLTKPSGKIPAIVSAITGIVDKQVVEAPPFADVKDDLVKFIGKHPIVGHNINFDINFLAGKGVELTNPRYDTWKLATMLVPELSSHSLEVLTNYLKIKHIESHRALDDVLASKDLFLRLVKRIYEVNYGVLQEINRYAVKHDWGLAAVFKQVLSARRGEKEKKSKVIAKPKTTPKKTDQRRVGLTEIEALFKKKEQLKKIITNYEFRPSQVALLQQLVKDFTGSKQSIINAGPGVGRYLAYLVAAAYQAQAKKTSQSVAISVSPFSLQKQLSTEEAEIVQNITPFNFTPALLEDRRKYLCRRRFEQFKNKPELSTAQMEALAKLLLWLDIAQFGLFTEMAWSYEDYRVEEQVNCDVKYCLQKNCSYYQDCFYYNAFQKAQKSDVVIFNHTALAAEGKSLRIKNVIFDEAQELEKQFTHYLSFQLSENSITRKLSWLDHDPGFLQLIPRKALLKKVTKSQVAALIRQATKIKDKTTLFFGVLGIFASQQKQDLAVGGDYFTLTLDIDVRQYPEWDRVKQAGQNYIVDMYAFLAQLDKLLVSLKQKSAQEIHCDLSGAYQDLYDTTKELEKIILQPEANEVAWLSLNNNYLQLSLSPQQVGDFLQSNLLAKSGSVSFVSSVFNNQTNTDYFRERLGLGEEYNQHDIAAPYQYDQQAKVIVPTDIVGHNQPGFHQDLQRIVMGMATKLKGKTIISCGSRAAVRKIFTDLALPLKEKSIKVLGLGISGGEDKVKQEYFHQDQAVLIVTHEFLLKNEIPSEKLACLIIHKLPFGFFSDPLTTARSQGGQNAFQQSALPEALLKWRQVFQQLIKSVDDRGVFIVLDNRVETARYGAEFIKNLPTSQVEYCPKAQVVTHAWEWLQDK